MSRAGALARRVAILEALERALQRDAEALEQPSGEPWSDRGVLLERLAASDRELGGEPCPPEIREREARLREGTERLLAAWRARRDEVTGALAEVERARLLVGSLRPAESGRGLDLSR
jgi:hypothetical protein